MAVSFDEYEKALLALSDALKFAKSRTDQNEDKIARDASIQRFEFCVELAWKCAAKKLGSQSTTAKPVIREMAQNALILNADKWFDYIEARDKSPHTYNENIAAEVFSIAKEFLPEGEKLLRVLKAK